jgi:uncharacterized protein (DUF58 family)
MSCFFRRMIVPSSRLLFWVAVLVVPFATVAGVVADSALLPAGIVALFFVLASLDAAAGLGVLEGIAVELPRIVRLSKDRAGALELLVRNERQIEKDVRFGLPLPREIVSEHDDLTAHLPATGPLSRFQWPCTPHRRGRYRLDRCYLEAASPLGFWGIRATRLVEAEVRVYPNLLAERAHAAALFLNRGSFGTHAQRQIGKGRDFEKLREYVSGDSYDEIHWKATAKHGRPATKVFQIERTQEVYVLIDASRLSARKLGPGSRPAAGEDRLDEPQARPPHVGGESATPALERFVTAALMLGLAAERQGDLFGLVTFSDRVHTFVRARNGKAHYAACRDAIYTLQSESVTPDFEELCSFLRLRLRKRALLVFLTALDDPLLAESFTRSVDLICRQHLVLVNMLQPPGARPVFSGPQVTQLDDLYQALGGHLQWHSLRELDKTLQRRGVSLALLDDERLSAQLVTQYLNVKRRQVL